MKSSVLKIIAPNWICIGNHIGSGIVDIDCTYMNVPCNIHQKHTAYTGESMKLLYKDFVDSQNIYWHIPMHILKLIQLIHSRIPVSIQLPVRN